MRRQRYELSGYLRKPSSAARDTAAVITPSPVRSPDPTADSGVEPPTSVSGANPMPPTALPPITTAKSSGRDLAAACAMKASPSPQPSQKIRRANVRRISSASVCAISSSPAAPWPGVRAALAALRQAECVEQAHETHAQQRNPEPDGNAPFHILQRVNHARDRRDHHHPRRTICITFVFLISLFYFTRFRLRAPAAAAAPHGPAFTNPRAKPLHKPQHGPARTDRPLPRAPYATKRLRRPAGKHGLHAPKQL